MKQINIHIVLKIFKQEKLLVEIFMREGKITLEKANGYQVDLLAETMNFKKHTKPRSEEKKTRKRNYSSKLFWG